MTGVDDGVGRQGEDLFSDAGEKLIPVASGQVPPTDAVRKKNIPAIELTRGGKIKAEAARAVTGDEQQLGVGPSGWNRPGILQQPGGFDRAKALGQAEGQHGIGLLAEKSSIGMIVDGATGPVGKISGVPDVVPVTVGKEEGVRSHFFLFEKVEETFRGIDSQEVAAKVNEVGVGGGESAAIDQGFRHGDPLLNRFVDGYDYV